MESNGRVVVQWWLLFCCSWSVVCLVMSAVAWLAGDSHFSRGVSVSPSGPHPAAQALVRLGR